MQARGWDKPDIILVTGDAYIDHPSFGVSLIGRWLEHHGFRVAILAQPRHHDEHDLMEFGPPRLFFGITAGNLDSIVANYTGNAKVRDQDSYSPKGNPYFGSVKERRQRRRPDRATIRYAALAKQAFPDTPIVLGGLEASLRRFVHYDYQQSRLRSSVLTDAKADVLVYGMGENAILEIAQRLERNESLTGISGTCERLTEKEFQRYEAEEPSLILPSWQEIQQDNSLYLQAELAIDGHARELSGTTLSQKQQAMWVRQNSPALPLSTAELDVLYSLPFKRVPHPSAPDIPAYRMVKDSVTIVRGCSGNCSFCAITRHQGPVVVSRSRESIVREVKSIAGQKQFKGTISDLGGPTANLFGTSCGISKCRKHDCFYPKLCKNLKVDEQAFLDLLSECARIQGVKHLHISSGLRMELLMKTPKLLARLIKKHFPGSMKIAPEHTEENVLRLMHKPGGELLADFLSTCRKMAEKSAKKMNFTPYFIASHPGCSEKDMANLAQKVKTLGLDVRQFQDFTPTPGTLSTAMYVSGFDRDNKQEIYVARGAGDRKKQRQVLENITLKEQSRAKKYGHGNKPPRKKRGTR